MEKKDLSEIDWTRNISFTAFGFAYLGGVQYYLCTQLHVLQMLDC